MVPSVSAAAIRAVGALAEAWYFSWEASGGRRIMLDGLRITEFGLREPEERSAAWRTTGDAIAAQRRPADPDLRICERRHSWRPPWTARDLH
jgi:hypothetical protein